MALEVLPTNHFDGHQNINPGQRGGHGADTTLAEYLRKFRTARVQVLAAGDVAVAFSEDMGTLNYTIGLSWQDADSDANDVVMRVKKSTIALGGFTVTLAGTNPDGYLHVIAIED